MLGTTSRSNAYFSEVLTVMPIGNPSLKSSPIFVVTPSTCVTRGKTTPKCPPSRSGTSCAPAADTVTHHTTAVMTSHLTDWVRLSIVIALSSSKSSFPTHEPGWHACVALAVVTGRRRREPPRTLRDVAAAVESAKPSVEARNIGPVGLEEDAIGKERPGAVANLIHRRGDQRSAAGAQRERRRIDAGDRL